MQTREKNVAGNGDEELQPRDHWKGCKSGRHLKVTKPLECHEIFSVKLCFT